MCAEITLILAKTPDSAFISEEGKLGRDVLRAAMRIFTKTRNPCATVEPTPIRQKLFKDRMLEGLQACANLLELQSKWLTSPEKDVVKPSPSDTRWSPDLMRRSTLVASVVTGLVMTILAKDPPVWDYDPEEWLYINYEWMLSHHHGFNDKEIQKAFAYVRELLESYAAAVPLLLRCVEDKESDEDEDFVCYEDFMKDDYDNVPNAPPIPDTMDFKFVDQIPPAVMTDEDEELAAEMIRMSNRETEQLALNARRTMNIRSVAFQNLHVGGKILGRFDASELLTSELRELKVLYPGHDDCKVDQSKMCDGSDPVLRIVQEGFARQGIKIKGWCFCSPFSVATSRIYLDYNYLHIGECECVQCV